MADLLDALQALARQRGRGESPLVALRSSAGRNGARISHLAISPALAQAWPGATGEPFHQHQSLAYAALRRGDALALAGGRSARRSMHLFLIESLHAHAQARALLLAPDELAAAAHATELARLIKALGQPLRVGLAAGAAVRAALGAQIVVATPAQLHERLLRHHARAWDPLWAHMRLIALAEAHAYSGPAAVHIGALLLRAQRLAPPAQAIQLLASIAPLAGAEAALAQIGGVAWRIISAEDTPAAPATLALWRAPGERAREALALALGLARAGVHVHLTCAPFEAPLLRALAGDDRDTLSIGPSPLPAEAQVIIGLELAGPVFAQAHDGAQLSVLVLGDDPAERALARLANRDAEPTPLLEPPSPYWVTASGNAYVEAQHLLCAASERPISTDEATAWGVEPLLARLAEQGRITRLPGPNPVWQPLPSSGDPYPGFDPHAVGGAPALIADEQGQPLATLDQASFDRWAFVGAALPPLRGGHRVVARDEEGLDLSIRAAPEARRTLPLRRCNVQVRDRREQRELRGCTVAWGRVIVEEELYGFREATPGAAPAERVISPPITARWSAPALWVDLPISINAAGQVSGWSLAAALPLITLSNVSDLAPAYDPEAQRIYFVDAQPGGNGLARWLFGALEQILPLAYDVALDCRNDPLLEPLARADMDWLLSLLGGAVAVPPPPPPPTILAMPTSGAQSAQAARRPAPPVENQAREPAQEPPNTLTPLSQPETIRRSEAARRAATQASPASPPAHPQPEPQRPAPAQPPAAPPPAQRPAPAQQSAAPPPAQRPAPAQPPAAPPPAQRQPEPPQRAEPARREATRSKRQSRQPREATTPPQPTPPAEPPLRPSEPTPPAEPPLRPSEPTPPAEPPLRPSEPTPPVEPPLRPSEPGREPEAFLPDAAAMVARLQRLREQRESQEQPTSPTPRPGPPASPRFQPGDQITCNPYGRGEVLASRIEDDHELLEVNFPAHGRLTIDAAVNAVRLL